MLLRPELYGGLNLDGELAETFTTWRQLPVLLKYKKVKSLLKIDPALSNELINSLVYNLCEEWGYDPEKIEEIYSDLINNKLTDMANEFKLRCDTSVKNNPDIQRSLNQ